MTVQETIEEKVRVSLQPVHLEVINESHMHNVPPGSESHFKVIVVSEHFAGMPRIRRHQTVNEILRDELSSRIHALSMHTLTTSEWTSQDSQILESPACLGGGKHDNKQDSR